MRFLRNLHIGSNGEPLASPAPTPAQSNLESSIRELITQKDYPCIAAIRSLHHNELRTGLYEGFGTGRAGQALRNDLRDFLEEFNTTGSEYLSFWASFEGDFDFSEEEFETRMWRELSFLTSQEQKAADWGPRDANPESPGFSFCLFGEPFFVVGMHANSSRKARRFEKPSLVFNVFRQFQSLQKKGMYDSMVRINRARDENFTGSVNPMAEIHGEKWEAIQFSGKENSTAWKCPFHFLFNSEKA